MMNGRNVKKNKYYDSYWTNACWAPTATLSPVLKRCFVDNIKPGQSLLDVGCGDGRHYGRILAQQVKQHVGLDISLEALRTAARQGVKPSLWCGQGRMPFKDNIFDAVVCIEVLEHLNDPEEIVGEMHRVLKPGGNVIVTVPNVAYFRERLLLLKGIFNPGGSPLTAWVSPWIDPHIRFFTLQTIKMLFRKMNFVVRETIGDGGNPVGDLPLIAKLAGDRIIYPGLAAFAQKRWPALWGSKIILIANK